MDLGGTSLPFWGISSTGGASMQARQCSRAMAAAALTRSEHSGTGPIFLPPFTDSVRAATTFLVQQQPRLRTSAASQRTHSLRSLRSAPMRTSSASGNQRQSTVPR